MARKGVLEAVTEVLDSGRSPEEVCGSDAELLAVVKLRLKRYEQINFHLDDLFPSSTDEGYASAPEDERLPSIPGYEIRSVYGRGGIGIVYEAVHLRLGRRVALKMLLAGDYASGGEMLRFNREAKSIAALRHPNIVQIFDFGEHEGRPFFTMELLEGGTLSSKLAGKPIGPATAAEIAATIAGAVDAAHKEGIVHRDLKPANILLTTGGVPKISDFGLAYQSQDPSITQIGQPLGTPSYMAPEQAAGKSNANAPAVDVYALGTILYESLTGRPPFRGMTVAETQQRVIDDIPLAPSRLQAGVPRDLDTICAKCLEKDPQRRYASAGDLAADLQRFMRHEPIRARPISWLGHALRWRRRHPAIAAVVTSAALFLVVLLTGLLAATAYFQQLEQRQHQLAIEKSQLAEANDAARATAVQSQRIEAEQRQQAEQRGQQLRRTLYFAQMNLAGEAAQSPSGIGRVSQWLAPWETGTPNLRNWEWYYLNSLCHRDQQTLTGHTAGVTDLARSLDGTRLASAGADGQVIVWDATKGTRQLCLKGHSRDVVAVAWSGDGKRIASASSDGVIIVWDAQTGAALSNLPGTPNSVNALSWNPQGDQLASAGAGRRISIWNLATRTIERSLGDHPKGVRTIAWNPDGRRIAAGGPDYNVYLWDAVTGACVSTMVGHVNFVTDLAWSPDGTRLASASNDCSIKIWNGETFALMQTLTGHSAGVSRVAWNDDGQRLASSSFDQTVKIWSIATGKATCTYRGHTMPATGVVWTAGDLVASSSFDATIKIWPELPSEEVLSLQPDTDGIRTAAWSHSGQWIAATDDRHTISIWNARTGDRRVMLGGATGEINALAWSPDDRRLAAGGEDGAIHIWNAENGDVETTIPTSSTIRALAWSQDDRLASGGEDCFVWMWNWRAGTVLQRLAAHSAAVRALCWSADSTMLASGSNDSTVIVWNPASGAILHALTGHTAAVTSLAWSNDPHRLASGSEDQTIRTWDPAAGTAVTTLLGHTTTVTAVGWSPDNNRLVSAGEDHTLKVWNSAEGDLALTLPTGASIPTAAAWNSDGRQLLAAGDHRFLRLYDASLGYPAAKAPPATNKGTP